MQALAELLPPTAVTHAVKLPFLGPRALNLIVAKSSLLQVFEPKTLPPLVLQNGTSNVEDTSFSNPRTKLVLIAEFPLAGTVTSLARIKASNTKSGGEALLVSFKDAKISLVEWDPETYSLSTVSIHYYETDDLQGSSWAPGLRHCASYLTADPSSRCAALKFGIRHLAVIPFRQLGDDLAIEGYDPDLDEAPQTQRRTAITNGEEKQTPYASSFVLPLTALDPNLVHPVDLAFLYDYREPTLGVLSASKAPSVSLTQERKDVLSYTAFTLDLEQRARTLLLSVNGLPSDLFKLVALPLPVGGTLLIGGNEIVHVDQSGKTNAVAVNEFARQVSAFPMSDQSDLGLRLEGCVVEQLNPNSGDMILILNNSALAVLSFRIDGRSVSGLSLKVVPPSQGGNLKGSAASCVAAMIPDVVFVGSEEADSLVVRCCRKKPLLSRKRSHAEMLGNEDGVSDEEVEDEDDLYADETPSQRPRELSGSTAAVEDLVFQVDDRLPNTTVNGEPCFTSSNGQGRPEADAMEPERHGHHPIALATGRDQSGGVSFLSKGVDFSLGDKLPASHASNVWCLNDRPAGAEKFGRPHLQEGTNHELNDRFVITTSDSEDGDGESTIYEWRSGQLEEKTGTDFDSTTQTLNAGIFCGGKRIVQVTRSEIRCLEQDLSLAQIFPMTLDDETDTELTITHTSLADPYLLVFRDDQSFIILKADDKGDQLEELDRGDAISAGKWITGCLYNPDVSQSTTLAFLFSADGFLSVFDLPNLSQASSTIEGVNLIPPILASENVVRRSPNRESVTELLVADLGEEHSRSPCLIIRTAEGGLALYQPYHLSTSDSKASFSNNLRWVKVSDTSLLKPREGDESTFGGSAIGPLKYIPNLGGYSAVFAPGKNATLILKDAKSLPGTFRIRDKNIRSLSGLHVATCNNGAAAVNADGTISMLQLPKDTRYCSTGWSIRSIHIGHQVDGISYDGSSGLYIVGINEPTSFKLPEDDDWHQEWAKEETALKATGDLAKVLLFDPKSFSIICELALERDEILTSTKVLELEISEVTYERKPLVVVSTAILKGEDLPANGSIYVFDIINVVPDPERPETNRSLKQLVREEVKGAVSALSEIGNEGFLLAAQGQKCMVRGLKEDNSLLPVAFLDVQCHVTVARNLKGTGLALIGDALRGVWLFGYSSEPYRMRVFGRTRGTMEVTAAEFLPWNKQLFLLVADADCDIHVLEYNPEDPKSMGGSRLLNRSLFHVGHFATSMTLIPYSSAPQALANSDEDVEMEPDEAPSSAKSILMTTQSGALGLITPLAEDAYRRLGALQAHMTGSLDHPCGLNPRAYRAVESEGFGSRGILDGQVLRRWHMLSTQRKSEACARVGSDVWEINDDLSAISGLHYL